MVAEESGSARYGVCRICDGPTQAGSSRCFCCALLVHDLGQPLAPLVSAFVYRIGDAAHRSLRGYKDAPGADLRLLYRRHLGRRFEAWLLREHHHLITRFGGGWGQLAVVPSTRSPIGSPVDCLMPFVPSLAGLPRLVLQRGPGRAGHLAAATDAFVPSPRPDDLPLSPVPAGAGRGAGSNRVLVVDDSVITGARAQSAVAAVRLTGARVAGVVTVGRGLTPGGAPWSDAYGLDRIRGDGSAVITA